MDQATGHPIMIAFRDAVSGDGFLAGISLSGRALMRYEDDGKWWMYGVRPAALAASGITIDEAFSHFHNRYLETLFDMAQEASSFANFKQEVERFFNEADANREDERLWDDAVNAMRAGELSPAAEFASLEKKSPENNPSQIAVECLNEAGKRFQPSDNLTPTYAFPSAVAA